MRIVLTEPEQRLAKYMGQQRYALSRQAGVVDQRVDPSGADLDINAMGAELALARLLNVYPDLDPTPRKGGHDLRWGGHTLDVKQTARPNGHLLATKWKDADQCDLYALLTGELPEYQFLGFYPASSLLQAHRLKNFGHGPTYAVEQGELITWKDIQW